MRRVRGNERWIDAIIRCRNTRRRGERRIFLGGRSSARASGTPQVVGERIQQRYSAVVFLRAPSVAHSDKSDSEIAKWISAPTEFRGIRRIAWRAYLVDFRGRVPAPGASPAGPPPRRSMRGPTAGHTDLGTLASLRRIESAGPELLRNRQRVGACTRRGETRARDSSSSGPRSRHGADSPWVKGTRIPASDLGGSGQTSP